MQYSFGTGSLYGVNTTTGSTPVRFGGLQDVSIDFAFTTKELYGQYQLPIAIGRGTAKVTGKAKFAQFNAQSFNDLFFGLSAPATGELKTAVAEAQTVSANVINVTNNAAKFSLDLGVVYSANGTILTKVTGSPLVGQYNSNANGLYTFNNTDNAVAMAVSYRWTDSSNGKLITMTNQLLGNAPTFQAVFTEVFSSKQQTLTLNACISNKLTLATKLEDFTIPEFDFQAFVDASGTLGTWGMDE